MPALSSAQRQAWEHIRAASLAERARARERISAALVPTSSLDQRILLEAVRRRGQVTFNFHPDRLLADGRTVAEAMLASGRYVSQFVTGISNGSRTAFAGGERDRWEERLFGGAYQAPSVQAGDRPKYGALNLMDHPDGAAPRFGSCYLVLSDEVRERCTFCFGDSHAGPADLGTSDAFEPVLAALLESAQRERFVLGCDGMDVPALVDWLLSTAPGPRRGEQGRALDHYIEAQVHGDVSLATDAETLVIDPSFIGTETGEVLEAIAKRYHLRLEAHAGFELPAEGIPEEFRGPAIPPLALRVQREYAHAGARINAALIGTAARSVLIEPERWRDWGTTDETLQHLKQLWHTTVHFGTLRPH